MTENEKPEQHPALDAAFCARLEHKLTYALGASLNPDLRGFWCDGVIASIDPPQSKRLESANLTIAGTVFLGRTGQEEYDLSLQFGRATSLRLRRGERIDDLLPDKPFEDWATVDISRKTLTIQLP